ncbi:hypothetical protein Bhz58_00034 [Stenotrophomonas phage vB_SmaS_Bhz58]|uniref:Uncharacterized protein n=1 Tax=Pseudomonas phage vB_PaeS-Yazdi-M TaxID=2746928 RepID=A0A6S6MMC7_9CAUD|nr:hypothetical protein PM393_gp38 [Pseudomonas phage vB_PaeS-Yazdi-M]BCG66169.1 hypothetical protein [Pseudomonas phage vB_PaeS-Yazdi-M]
MANIIAELTARIEEYRKDNKNPCKNYGTEAAAEKATAKAAANIGNYFAKTGEGKPARYVVFYVEAWGRWVGCIELSETLRRPESTGGYLGVEPGFFKF